MKLYIVCVRDRALPAFGTPFFVAHIGQAVRSFKDEVNSRESKSQLGQHPEDFDLFELGSYDDGDAKFVILDAPRQIAVGKDLVVPVN